ncbi:hypothetical protein CJ030_MR6G003921 [Morella rubra]|uniref:Uncharacterized protein n=1 Tax=Morella rubra TaxID=262757 RepID=A0A6A1VBI6_9ROSI|nr:hypothetical protein CJ030_MR6G003921 [Morella rubra]
MSIQMEDNSWVTGRTAIGDSLIQYFTQLFDSTNPSLPSDFANLISPVIVKKIPFSWIPFQRLWRYMIWLNLWDPINLLDPTAFRFSFTKNIGILLVLM